MQDGAHPSMGSWCLLAAARSCSELLTLNLVPCEAPSVGSGAFAAVGGGGTELSRREAESRFPTEPFPAADAAAGVWGAVWEPPAWYQPLCWMHVCSFGAGVDLVLMEQRRDEPLGMGVTAVTREEQEAAAMMGTTGLAAARGVNLHGHECP